MKKTISLLLAALVILTLFAACEKKETSPAESSFEALLKLYRAPAEVEKIDLTAEDPSTDGIRFTFNEDGSIKNYVFSIDGNEFLVTLSEKETYIQIYAFTADGTVIAAETFAISAPYDPSIGFTEKDGYYFKGYSF